MTLSISPGSSVKHSMMSFDTSFVKTFIIYKTLVNIFLIVPLSMFVIPDIIKTLKHQFLRAISLIYFMFSSVLDVTGQPEHYLQQPPDLLKIICAIQKFDYMT